MKLFKVDYAAVWRGSLSLSIMCAVAVMTVACRKDAQPGPDTPPVTEPDPEYVSLTLRPETAQLMDFAEPEPGVYTILTKGEDHWIFTSAIDGSYKKEMTVLSFDYRAPQDIGGLQIFFADPISGERMFASGEIWKSDDWSEYSVNLWEPMYDFNWGSAGDYFRLDFGSVAGTSLEIKNIRLRTMTSKEKEEAAETEKDKYKDVTMASEIRKYLAGAFDASVTGVDVGADKVTVSGSVPAGGYALAEITPYMEVTQPADLKYRNDLGGGDFSLTFDRFAELDGVGYDRALSKWVVVKGNSLASHARYADKIHAYTDPAPAVSKSKKGLGIHAGEPLWKNDFKELAIHNTALNLPITEFMYATNDGSCTEHEYCGRKYYFKTAYMENIDGYLRLAAEQGAPVAGILLIQPAAIAADQTIGKVLQHPNFSSPGMYTMPNMTTPEGVQAYAAAMDFLAERYSDPSGRYGRIHKWIIHNEVDMGIHWTNMGLGRPVELYTDAYVKSLRICANIVAQHDPGAWVLGSFTHSWTQPEDIKSFAAKEMIDMVGDYSRAEGDFRWGLAYHSYPQSLADPRTWNDQLATYSMNTPFVTFKNLEVLDAWSAITENKYKGAVKRPVWLSENGASSPTYGEADLRNQAAALAFAWKKVCALDGIDVLMWHNWRDHPDEVGIRLGLRKYPADGSATKPSWDAYKAAGTSGEEAAFEPFKSVIGIAEWDDIMHPLQ